MYLGFKEEKRILERTSKLGLTHSYERTRVYALFRCDNCGSEFERLKQKMSPKRLSNNYFHCCPACDPKRFAQKKGAERRTIWDTPVSSTADISRL